MRATSIEYLVLRFSQRVVLLALTTSITALCCQAPLVQPPDLGPLVNEYQTVKMSWRYWGESRGLSLQVRWYGYEVKYLEPEESDILEVMHDGSIWRYLKSGERVEDRFLNYRLLVMDKRGRLYIGTGEFDDVHHSSITRGGPVAAAGVVTFDASGNISSYQDATGHYFRAFFKVPGLNWRNLRTELERRRIDTSPINYWPYDGAMNRIGLIDRIVLNFIDYE